MKKSWVIAAAMIVGALSTEPGLAAPLRIASLNPIMGDLARQVGGDRVEVIDLMPVDANPHVFYPSPDDLKSASDADLVIASGKGLETYLDEFRESLGRDIPILELGRGVPSLRVEVSEVFVCCPTHASGAIDPHWWHSIKNVRRAARILSDELSGLDPDGRDYFQQRYKDYAGRLDDLYSWAKREITSVPRADRELTTSHAAFGYLCRELGLRSITVQGLTTENSPEPAYLKDVIETLRRHDVRAVFPEDAANPKVLKGIAREAGVRIAGHLYAGSPPADGPTYEEMMRRNIQTIVGALKPVD